MSGFFGIIVIMVNQKVAPKIDKRYEKSKKDLLDELFYDTYKHKKRIIRLNFYRGLAFGAGSAIGGSILLALVVFFLTKAVDWFPLIGDFVKEIIKYLGK